MYARAQANQKKWQKIAKMAKVRKKMKANVWQSITHNNVYKRIFIAALASKTSHDSQMKKMNVAFHCISMPLLHWIFETAC